eukprot:COSAG02_NODE_6307_length_3665_cov_3.765564_4_plen_107_part_00
MTRKMGTGAGAGDGASGATAIDGVSLYTFWMLVRNGRCERLNEQVAAHVLYIDGKVSGSAFHRCICRTLIGIRTSAVGSAEYSHLSSRFRRILISIEPITQLQSQY